MYDNVQSQDDDLTDYTDLELAELRKLNHTLAVLLGRVTYFLEFEQGSPITRRRTTAKKLLDEINKATGGKT